MLQKLGDHIANCLARAADAERHAAEASSEDVRIGNERLAKSWRYLAHGYLFAESMERFLLDAKNAKGARPPDPPIEGFVVPPPVTVFGPEATAALALAYRKAIEGQPLAVHEIIAKRILELASEGERDPDKLCHGALAPSMREPRSIA
jgi:hypothetical protein